MAIVISAVLALIQVYFQINGELKLEAVRFTSSLKHVNRLEKSQTTRLDSLNSKVEETNKALLELKQSLADRLDPGSPI